MKAIWARASLVEAGRCDGRRVLLVSCGMESTLAIVPKPVLTEDATLEYEPVAEHNFGRAKLMSLEIGINNLHRKTREQHEVVSHLEEQLSTMVSETDLRRAIGLAFQEFEGRFRWVPDGPQSRSPCKSITPTVGTLNPRANPHQHECNQVR